LGERRGNEYILARVLLNPSVSQLSSFGFGSIPCPENIELPYDRQNDPTPLVDYREHAREVHTHGASRLSAARIPGVEPKERDLRTCAQYKVKGIGVAMDDLVSVIDGPVD
jgi:hypothetical protein